MSTRIIRIGGASGFWGDTPEGARQLIEAGGLDYLVFDYLAEVTMSILARARDKNPALGHATDFVSHVIRPYAKQIADGRMKIIANAGGVNPRACVAAIERELASQGVSLRVAAVVGDDVMALMDQQRSAGTTEMFSATPMPASFVSANAYLGAFPIAAALAEGADIVVTGRCVDSALALGPLIHEFGWSRDDFDALSAGSLVGHVLECGTQCTGGFQTDWEEQARGWSSIGFPIAECMSDGSFVVTKPAATGGAVTRQSVSEQVSYETGDPAAYPLPDVICDWRDVRVQSIGEDRVRVTGARGAMPPSSYKVSATWADGFRCMSTMLVRGMQAVPKARAVANAILERCRHVMTREGFGDFAEVSIELLGAEEVYGAGARTAATREVVLKLAVRHADAKALEIFAREIFPTATSTVQGLSGVFGGRPKIQPVIRLFSMLLDKQRVPVGLVFEGREIALEPGAGMAMPARAPSVTQPSVPAAAETTAGTQPRTRVPLVAIAYARSGDKGDLSNIAVLARDPEFVPLIAEQMTTARVRDFMSTLVAGRVERFDWPGLDGFNFVLHEALGGGGVGSLRYDPQGKAHAQILLEFPIEVPARWIDEGRIGAMADPA